MIQEFVSYLTIKNLPYSFINDNHSLISFKKGLINYLFSCDSQDDSHYCKILIPNIKQYDNVCQSDFDFLNKFSSEYKVGKAMILDIQHSKHLWLEAEAFVYSYDNLNALFDRLISVVDDMFNEFKSIEDGKK